MAWHGIAWFWEGGQGSPAIANLPPLPSSPVSVGCSGAAPGRPGPAAPQVRAGRGTAGAFRAGWVPALPGLSQSCSFLPPQPRQRRGSPDRGRPRRGGAGEDAAGQRSGGRAPRGRVPRPLTADTGPLRCTASHQAGPGKRTSITLHPGLVGLISSGGFGLPAPLPGETPLRGADGAGQRVACSGCHQDNVLLNNIPVHCCDTICVLGGCSAPGIQDLLSNMCFISARRIVSPERKFSVRTARKDCVIVSTALACSRSYVLYRLSSLEEKLRSEVDNCFVGAFLPLGRGK